MMGNSIEDDDDSFTKPLGRQSVIYYGMGHMLNDITAAYWFTYLLLFLTDIGLSPRDAAMVMLSGSLPQLQQFNRTNSLSFHGMAIRLCMD
ncbi:hypothetical protein ACB092_11G152000 [Castanea dentata]